MKYNVTIIADHEDPEKKITYEGYEEGDYSQVLFIVTWRAAGYAIQPGYTIRDVKIERQG